MPEPNLYPVRLGICVYTVVNVMQGYSSGQLLGWVDFNYNFPPILLSYSAPPAKLSSAQAESGKQLNSQNHSQPNPVTNP